jgi:hypothetical protein
MGISIYQSYLGEEQQKFISPIALGYDADQNIKNNQREYELFKKIYQSRKNNPDPWGLVSWKFEHKTLIKFEEFHRLAELELQKGYDCVFINPMIGNEAIFPDVWSQGIYTHKNMNVLVNFLKKEAVPNILDGMLKNSFAFNNFFVGSPKFWDHYFRFVDEILELFEDQVKQKTITGLIYSHSANYQRDLSVTFRPFLIERLFSSFIQVHPFLKTKAFVYSLSGYTNKFGLVLGKLLFQLSSLKNQGALTKDQNMMNEWSRIRKLLLKNHKIRGHIFNLDDPDTIFLTEDIQNLIKKRL